MIESPKVFPVIQSVDVPPSPEQLEEIIRSSWSDEIPYVCTPAEVEFLRHFAPTAYNRMKGRDLDAPDDDIVRRVILQGQSEVVNRQSVLDAAILAGKRNQRTVDNHEKSVNRVIRLFDFLQVPVPDQVERRFSDSTEDFLIRMKLAYAEILGSMPEWQAPIETTTKQAVPIGDDPHFAYVGRVVEAVGPEIVKAVVLYGSGARERALQTDAIRAGRVKDLDNYLIVEDGSLPEVYARLQPVFADLSNGLPVSFNIIEESTFARFTRMNHDPRESLETSVVLYGSAEFPHVSDFEIQERGASFAAIRLRSLKSAVVGQIRNPTELAIPALFDYFQKTPLFMVQSGLNIERGVEPRSKADFLAIIEQMGGGVAEYTEDAAQLTRATIRSAAVAPHIVERFFRGRRFTLDMDVSATSFDRSVLSDYDEAATEFLGAGYN